MKISLLAAILLARFNMSDADAAAPADSAPAVATAPDVSITVPAAHVGLFERVVALLKKDEQTIVDNIHAGVSALEAMFKSDDAEKEDVGTSAETGGPAV